MRLLNRVLVKLREKRDIKLGIGVVELIRRVLLRTRMSLFGGRGVMKILGYRIFDLPPCS